jgi:ABC-type transporter Mla MlaB component
MSFGGRSSLINKGAKGDPGLCASEETPNPPEHSPRSPNVGGTPVFVIGGRITPADIPALCLRAEAVLAAGDLDPLVCDVATLAHADAVAVDALARLHVLARRHRCNINLLGVSRQLKDLLALMGLCDVLVCRERLPLEARWEPEQREQARRVEEEGDSGNATG